MVWTIQLQHSSLFALTQGQRHLPRLWDRLKCCSQPFGARCIWCSPRRFPLQSFCHFPRWPQAFCAGAAADCFFAADLCSHYSLPLLFSLARLTLFSSTLGRETEVWTASSPNGGVTSVRLFFRPSTGSKRIEGFFHLYLNIFHGGKG